MFDEATSALDIDTERALMKTIDGLNQELTIVMIAHRLSTLQHCDRIIDLAQGAVLLDGSQADVLKL